MDTKELVERCRRGERQAMGLLYSTYAEKLESVSRKYLRNEADVQDVVHDSFVVILTSLDRLKDARKLESWMYTIVRNLSLKQAQQPSLESVEKVEIAEGSGLDSPDFERLMTLVGQLPAGYQSVLKLSVLEGLSHKEIGEMLGIGAHSSSSQLARAKEMMRKWIVRCGILLAALATLVVPFLLPEKEMPQEKVAEADGAEEKGGKTGAESLRNSMNLTASTASMTSRTFEEIKRVKRIEEIERTKEGENVDRIEEIKESEEIKETEILKEKASQPKDSTKRILPEERLVAEDYPVKKKAAVEWQLAISFASGSPSNLLATNMSKPGINSGWADPTPPVDPPIDDPNNGPYGDPNNPKPDMLTTTETRHYTPLTFGVSLSRSLSKNWSVETGLRYTFMRSETTTTISLSNNSIAPMATVTEQRLHYIGIPLRVSCRLSNSSPFALYATGGAAADIPLGESAPLLWSLNFGAGFQYQLTPSVSLYAEPNLNYYLNPSAAAPTIRTDRPMEFTLPIGFRLSW